MNAYRNRIRAEVKINHKTLLTEDIINDASTSGQRSRRRN